MISSGVIAPVVVNTTMSDCSSAVTPWRRQRPVAIRAPRTSSHSSTPSRMFAIGADVIGDRRKPGSACPRRTQGATCVTWFSQPIHRGVRPAVECLGAVTGAFEFAVTDRSGLACRPGGAAPDLRDGTLAADFARNGEVLTREPMCCSRP